MTTAPVQPEGPAYWELITTLSSDSDAEGGALIDLLSDRFLEAGALSVSVEDLQAGHESLEAPLFGEPGSEQQIRAWPTSRITILLPVQLDAPGWWRELAADDEQLEALPIECRALDEEDWVSKTQRQFQPIEVLDRIWIGPHWHQPPSTDRDSPRFSLQIDPGQAFGTGSHATTQLCLEALLACADLGPLGQVMDVGSGSGVLALAAERLGAEQAYGEDIDPVAVETARRNATLNAAHRSEFELAGHLAAQEGQVGGPTQRFDLVLANILAQPLKLLAPMLLDRVRPGGSLVLSGLLVRQVSELIDHYDQARLESGLDSPIRSHPRLRLLGQRDGWACIGFLKGVDGAFSNQR